MKLYHGSTVIVDKPLVSYGRNNLDFGKGNLLQFESSYEAKGDNA